MPVCRCGWQSAPSGSIFGGSEGAIGGISEIPVQAIVQTKRREFGEQPDFAEAFEAIMMATAGGGLFGGTVKAGIRGAQRISSALDAQAYLIRNAEMRAQSPLEDAGEHAARYDHATQKMRGERDDPLPPDPESPVKKSHEIGNGNGRKAVEQTGDETALDAVAIGERLRAQASESASVQPKDVVTIKRTGRKAEVLDASDPDSLVVRGPKGGRQKIKRSSVKSVEKKTPTEQPGPSAQRGRAIAENEEMKAGVEEQARDEDLADMELDAEKRYRIDDPETGESREMTGREMLDDIMSEEEAHRLFRECMI